MAERLIDESAAVMGQTAENLHDAFPHLTKDAADTYAVESQRRAGKAWDDGVMDDIRYQRAVTINRLKLFKHLLIRSKLRDKATGAIYTGGGNED